MTLTRLQHLTTEFSEANKHFVANFFIIIQYAFPATLETPHDSRSHGVSNKYLGAYPEGARINVARQVWKKMRTLSHNNNNNKAHKASFTVAQRRRTE